MSERLKDAREWAALALGILGTIAGCVSLIILWQQAASERENLSVSVNIERTGYSTFIERGSAPRGGVIPTLARAERSHA